MYTYVYMFEIPLSSILLIYLERDSPIYKPQYSKGSTIPELIINQHGS